MNRDSLVPMHIAWWGRGTRKVWGSMYCRSALLAILCLSWLCVGATIQAQPRVKSVQVQGLERTRLDYVMSFLQTRPDNPYSEEQINIDEQSLRNLQLFASVDSKVIVEGDEAFVVYNVRERVTQIPITKFGGITDNFWFQVGINDYNFLGRGGYFGGYYQFYDRHSFKVFQQMPQLFNQRWGLSYVLGRQSTREPAYFQDGSSEFDVDRWEAIALARFEMYRNLKRHELLILEFGGGYLNETYNQRPGATFLYEGETHFDKYFLTAVLRYEKLNYFFHYISGIAPGLTLQRVATVSFDDTFWKLLGEVRWYQRLGKRANPALRVRLGISSNEDSPFVPFVLDSYLNVRGSGNRVARGTSELTINLEYRHTLIDRKKWALQGVLFVDNSAWRPAGAPLLDMFLPENVVSFGGGRSETIYTKNI